MKHPFIPSIVNKALCASCKRDYLAHSAIAHCDSCSSQGNCELFGYVDNLTGNPETAKRNQKILQDERAMLLCASCTEKEWLAVSQANDVTIAKLNVPSQSKREQLVEESRATDQTIRYNGDVYNAVIISTVALKSAILADESIGTIQDREFKFQNEIATRLEHLKSVVFELDDKKHKAITEQIALRESLRDFASSLREEIRERIKLSDANYQPHNIIKAPKITKPKVSPMDRLIESFMLLHGCNREEAENIITKGKSQ